MGSKTIFIKPSRGNRILLLQFSDSLGPEAHFLGTKLSGGGRPEEPLASTATN